MNSAEVAALLQRCSGGLDDGLASAARVSRQAALTRGRVVQAVGTLIRAASVSARVGELCALVDLEGGRSGMAEVVGFSGNEVWLNPLSSIDGLGPSTLVRPLGRRHTVAVGDFLLGRVVDGMGSRFLDDGPPLPTGAPQAPVQAESPLALKRPSITQALSLQLRAVDGLLTCGLGQRLGVFAPAGCGKSTLMSMVCRNAAVDVVVVALVGERGREVADFLADALGSDAARQRSVMVVATSERPAIERLKAAFVATTYAEHFRAQGHSVLLLVDSVTRLARAAREIGLAAGEPPTRRGFPPSVFALLPRLFERAGLTEAGALTAFYTVLEESDDGSDPVSEEVRSLLDGSIVLSRKLAGRGHFPAIDVLASASRLMSRVVPPSHLALAARVRELMGKHEDVELLLRIGEYQRGLDPESDLAIDLQPRLLAFLRQGADAPCAPDDTLRLLREMAS
jgi:ATP synthase in type III secretion protein N